MLWRSRTNEDDRDVNRSRTNEDDIDVNRSRTNEDDIDVNRSRINEDDIDVNRSRINEDDIDVNRSRTNEDVSRSMLIFLDANPTYLMCYSFVKFVTVIITCLSLTVDTYTCMYTSTQTHTPGCTHAHART